MKSKWSTLDVIEHLLPIFTFMQYSKLSYSSSDPAHRTSSQMMKRLVFLWLGLGRLFWQESAGIKCQLTSRRVKSHTRLSPQCVRVCVCGRKPEPRSATDLDQRQTNTRERLQSLRLVHTHTHTHAARRHLPIPHVMIGCFSTALIQIMQTKAWR